MPETNEEKLLKLNYKHFSNFALALFASILTVSYFGFNFTINHKIHLNIFDTNLFVLLITLLTSLVLFVGFFISLKKMRFYYDKLRIFYGEEIRLENFNWMWIILILILIFEIINSGFLIYFFLK